MAFTSTYIIQSCLMRLQSPSSIRATLDTDLTNTNTLGLKYRVEKSASGKWSISPSLSPPDMFSAFCKLFETGQNYEPSYSDIASVYS